MAAFGFWTKNLRFTGVGIVTFFSESITGAGGLAACPGAAGACARTFCEGLRSNVSAPRVPSRKTIETMLGRFPSIVSLLDLTKTFFFFKRILPPCHSEIWPFTCFRSRLSEPRSTQRGHKPSSGRNFRNGSGNRRRCSVILVLPFTHSGWSY